MACPSTRKHPAILTSTTTAESAAMAQHNCRSHLNKGQLFKVDAKLSFLKVPLAFKLLVADSSNSTFVRHALICHAVVARWLLARDADLAAASMVAIVAALVPVLADADGSSQTRQ